MPTLNVAGWWDQEDFYGPIKIYELFERHDTKGENFLVVGPWNHGGWSRGAGRTLGRIDFGSDTAAHYRRNILAPFFAHYLEGQGPRAGQRSAHVSHRSERVGGARSMAAHRQCVDDARLYFSEGSKLSFVRAAGFSKDDVRQLRLGSGEASALSAAADQAARGLGHLAASKISVSSIGRPDVLDYATEPLTEDVVVSGQISAHLFAATSGTDSDSDLEFALNDQL